MKWIARWVPAYAGYYASKDHYQYFDVKKLVSNNRYPFALDAIMGNTRKEGTWAYKVSSKQFLNKAKSCIEWLYKQPVLSFEVEKVSEDCPCTIEQAVLDQRYWWSDATIRTCLFEKFVNEAKPASIRNCLFPHGKGYVCVNSAGPKLLTIDGNVIESENGNPLWYDYRCCYELLTGSLLTDSEFGLSSVVHVSDLHPLNSSSPVRNMISEMMVEDLTGFNYCCQDANDVDLCDKYFKQRHIPTCSNYSAPDRCKLKL